MKSIFHIDVNSAYLSWEAKDRLARGETLDLRTVPSAVGGDPKKRQGIILAKSIPAKKYGIKTGESLPEAFHKCPNLIVVPPNYGLYMQCSHQMNEIFKQYSPLVQRYSVDESFIDYSNMEHLFGDPLKVAHEIKNRIKKELGFTVSVGVSTNKLLAKMASDLKKPDAVITLYPEEVPEKMWPLPVGDLFMVGRRTRQKLENLNIETIGDLANTEVDLLKMVLKSHGVQIWNFANGIENSAVAGGPREVKGIGNSTTIPNDVYTKEEAYLVLLSLAETVGMRLRAGGFGAGLVSIGIKTNTFLYYSHQRKLEITTDSTQELYEIAKELFREVWGGEVIRHLGLRVSNLKQGGMRQLNLFEESGEYERHQKIDRTIDALRLRYKPTCVFRGCFANTKIKPLQGGVGEEDYPMMSSLL